MMQNSVSKREAEPGRTHLLGVATEVYVISLLERQDRREQMECLREALNLSWTIIDATSFKDPLIYRLLDWVVLEREQTPLLGENPTELSRKTSTNFIFRWPREINALAVITHEPLLPAGSEVWEIQPPSLPISIKPSSPSSPPSLMSAVDDYSMPTGILREVDWMKLTPGRVACWHSHLSAIRAFIDKGDTQPEDVAVFLEDDVDMEEDIANRLSETWKVLPAGWDIVMLGHCWSNEASYPSLSIQNANSVAQLHPSYSPKCTHAYALSLSGARRLLQHLRYPPFAYSRALDHAFSHLIESGRLRAYSVVPSVIVQRKVTPSDILPGLGSERNEWLTNGVLGK